MKSDGSARFQLTYPPVAVVEPHWSPDGRRVAFMGQLPNGRRRIYLLTSEGGVPQEVAPEDPMDQGVPTWSPDGTWIVFGELLYRTPKSEMAVRVLDLSRHMTEVLPGSLGKWTPRWSPDGRFIAALTTDSKNLVLYDVRSKKWQDLTTFPFIDFPTWSVDSSSISFMAQDNEGRDRNYYRIRVGSRKLEGVADLNGIQRPAFAWNGTTPDGSPLALSSVQITEIYALTLQR
jgi:Tol biopolymer transport system component